MKLPGKDLLRVQALERLTHLSLERREEAAIAAFSFLTTYFLESETPVVSFSSKPLEINLHPFNDYLMKKGKLFLPRHENDSLTIYHVQSKEELILSPFSIYEPDPNLCRRIDPEEIDLILVPGLCFDAFHHRVGYGKGLFDKLLYTLPKAKKWGVGLKEQWIEKIPTESHDIKLDKTLLY